MKAMKKFEIPFDIVYLLTAMGIGIILINRSESILPGVMAIVLAAGDSLHLLPRIASIATGDVARYNGQLGFGKAVTSITMTVYYIILWNIGLRLYNIDGGLWTYVVYALGAIRILISIMPQNDWLSNGENRRWGIYRNIPFLLLGGLVALLFWNHREAIESFKYMWLAISMSFIFYIPVVLFSHRSKMWGMLMLPKSCMYIYMLTMFL